MIYTVTFNPAIDYVMKLEQLKPGATNRSQFEEIFFGGKGINISRVLKELGTESTALGFCAGFTGDAIVSSLLENGIPADFVKLKKGYSRINVKVKGEAETEINGQGPNISDSEVQQLFDRLLRLQDGDILILAGSIPNSLPADIYEQILKSLQDKEICFVVDATKELLLNALKYHPFLIKPNLNELEELFGCTISSEEEICSCARELKQKGALNVLVSLGAEGAFLLDEEDCVHRMCGIPGEAVNSVGAGDSMIAGFLSGYLKNKNYADALKLGMAAGTATAFSMDLATKERIDKMIKRIS